MIGRAHTCLFGPILGVTTVGINLGIARVGRNLTLRGVVIQ